MFEADAEYKEVDFKTHCATCENRDLSEFEQPCNHCLCVPMNVGTDKPVHWKEREEA